MSKPIVGYYDKDGNPIDLMTWGNLIEDRFYSVLAHDQVGPFRISTVWMGLDHNWCQHEIHIFETMIFADNPSHELDHYQKRYSNKEAALKGHAQTLRMTKMRYASMQRDQESLD